MYDIKKKKIWTKRFTENELDIIWNSFSKVTPYLGVPDIKSGKDLNQDIAILGYFIHPETDYSNDTVGIEPKTLKKWISINGIETLTDILFILNVIASSVIEYDRNKYIDQDNQFNWDQLMKDICFSDNTPLTIEESILNFMTIYSIDYDFEVVAKNPWIIGLFTKEFISKYTDIDKFIISKVDKWKKAFKQAPKSIILVSLVNPSNFSFEYIKWVKHVYNKGLMELPMEEQYKVSLAIMTRPLNIIENSSRYVNFVNDRYNENVFPEIPKKVLNKLSSKVLETLGYNVLAEFFTNLDNKYIDIAIPRFNHLIKSNNIHSLNILFSFYLTVKNNSTAAQMEFAFSLENTFIYSICNQHSVGGSVQVLSRYMSVWNNRSKTKNIKSLSFTEGKYTASILDINDMESLILGQITDCCQVVHGHGESCLISGLKYESQGFVKVTKKSKIFAQSWYWTATLKGKRVLCFDSIEVLSENLEQGKTIVDAYVGLSKKLIDLDIVDIVVAGNDGQSFPEELNENFESVNEFMFYNPELEFNKEEDLNNLNIRQGIYTDTRELGQVILMEK